VSDPYLDEDEMTADEEAGVLLALDEDDAGLVVPLEEAIHEIRMQRQ